MSNIIVEAQNDILTFFVRIETWYICEYSMKDLREEVVTKACIVGKIVKSRVNGPDTWSE